MKVVHWFFCFALLTASFDIALVIKFGGTVRSAQIASLLVVFAGMYFIVKRGRVIVPPGGGALFLWACIQALLIPMSINIPTDIVYVIWLWLIVAGYFSAVQLYRDQQLVMRLMRFYLLSYFFIAVFGLYQFFSPWLHLPSLLVKQWFIEGSLARINGFSYEPSYFATYLIMGWVVLLDLLNADSQIVSGKWWRAAFAVETAALVLSTSRTAWAMMILIALFYLSLGTARKCKVLYLHLSHRPLFLSVPSRTTLFKVFIVFMVGCSLFYGVGRLFQGFDYRILLVGTGLDNTAAHSVNDRSAAFENTVDVFMESPLIGRSLIGPSERIKQITRDNDSGDAALGVFMETLASSGVIGILPFIWFVVETIVAPRRISRALWPQEEAKWLRGMYRALIVEWITLQTNQNIMREYLWLHLTVLAVLVCAARRLPDKEQIPWIRESTAPSSI